MPHEDGPCAALDIAVTEHNRCLRIICLERVAYRNLWAVRSGIIPQDAVCNPDDGIITAYPTAAAVIAGYFVTDYCAVSYCGHRPHVAGNACTIRKCIIVGYKAIDNLVGAAGLVTTHKAHCTAGTIGLILGQNTAFDGCRAVVAVKPSTRAVNASR